MTSISYLIDTDWVIDHLNGLRPVTERLQELEPKGLVVSIVTLAELWEGVSFSRDRNRSEMLLREFIDNVLVIGIDGDVCKHFGQIRGRLRRQGKIIGDLDILMAASSLQHSLILLTNNRRHLRSVPRRYQAGRP